MKRALAFTLTALLAACASEPEPKPAAPTAVPAPAPEAPSIQTQPSKPATATPAPTSTVAPADPPTPASALPATVSAALVEKTFAYHRRFFNTIYRERLKAKPKLSGTMLVSFTINPDGTTRDAKLEHSTLNDPPFEQDILKQIGQTSFPPAAGMTAVDKYPLEFSRK